mmetsp:Transcript_13599/g.32354  ORF Transcript_13599/g.32354 Transcript_13599/m.32354 type:complete len:204 (+) Transcript_13599:143-754(+)
MGLPPSFIFLTTTAIPRHTPACARAYVASPRKDRRCGHRSGSTFCTVDANRYNAVPATCCSCALGSALPPPPDLGHHQALPLTVSTWSTTTFRPKKPWRTVVVFGPVMQPAAEATRNRTRTDPPSRSRRPWGAITIIRSAIWIRTRGSGEEERAARETKRSSPTPSIHFSTRRARWLRTDRQPHCSRAGSATSCFRALRSGCM